MRLHGRYMSAALLVAGALAANVNVVRADVVAARGKPPLVSTQVLRLSQGRLMCRGDGGTEVGFGIEQVDYIQITGWQMFNLAEKQRRAEDWRRAAVSYERALADLQMEPAPQGQTLDRELLVKCRLIPAWDAQARFERAVELYLNAIEQMPEGVESLRPTQFPETGSAVLEMAARQVDASIERHGDDAIARSLTKWKSRWPARPTSSAPADGMQLPPLLQVENRWREAIRKVAELVQAGRHDSALRQIGELHKQVEPAVRAELFYWQGRALEEMTATTTGTRPSGETTSGATPPLAAGAIVAYMRVVVHFPRHRLAAECLYRAADVCRRAKDLERASMLWSELIAVYPHAKGPDGKVWADLARKELKE